jgi:uncharacterized protein
MRYDLWMPVPGWMLLAGMVGSQAYGLATENSDVDRLGMYAAPTSHFHGLNPPTGKRATWSNQNPDRTAHEAAKFISLYIKGNPTIVELLWMSSYEIRTPRGTDLIDLRVKLLSAEKVRNAYLGYAIQQFKRLSDKGRFPDVPTSRIEKHARHLLRICEQAVQLWKTATLTLQVDDPDRFFSFGKRVAAGDINAASSVIARTSDSLDAIRCLLPAVPDSAAAENWLHQVRDELWEEEGLRALLS